MSQTSQSSIEVLLRDSNDSRKPSEERRFAQIVDSDALKAAATKEDDAMTTSAMKQSEEIVKQKAILAIGSVNLTESSSSGSICESVVTAYDKSERQKTSLGKKSSDAGLDGIFTSSQNLLKKTPKQKHDSTSYGFTPIQYNYDDLSIVVSSNYFSSENQNSIIFSPGSSFKALLVPTSIRGEQ